MRASRLVVATVVLIVLVACGGAPATAADLESLAFHPGDLPAEIQRGQAEHEAPGIYETLGVPPAREVVFQDFDSSAAASGNVIVSLYDSTAERDDAYMRIVAERNEGSPSIDGLGDKSAGQGGCIVFTRCSAVVRIVLPTQPGAAATYAKRLDKRLQQNVC